MEKTIIYFSKNHYRATTPEYDSEENVGADLFLAEPKTVILKGMERRKLDLKISIHIPQKNVYAQIMPRSSISEQGLLIHPGVIDKTYEGNIKVLVWNTNMDTFRIPRNVKICQLVFLHFEQNCHILELPKFQMPMISARGDKGFGSTGVSKPSTIC